MRPSVSFALIVATITACSSADKDRSDGQSSFESAPPNGQGNAGVGDANGPTAGTGAGSAPVASPTQSTRTVEETDLYRLEGNRLYYLNSYRGLMVFDVTNPDQPALLGRSPIFGTPVDMIVRNGIATVVVGDWYGVLDDGSPFHGSIVRGLDATDPTNIRVIGDAKLGGWVRDDRVVGDVIYAVSEDYGWSYGWDVAVPGVASGAGGVDGIGYGSSESVIVSSVNFANGAVAPVNQLRFDGFNGVFNVTPNAIMLASSGTTAVPGGASNSQTSLLYLDISDPAGAIVKRGSLSVAGQVNGWGADNGRWNLDFADGKTAHVIGQASYDYNGGYTLSTVDFSNPDAPVLDSALAVAGTGWSAAARFDTNRLYLSPDGYYNDDGSTPFQVFDLTNPKAPKLAGTVAVPGSVWNILPAPNSKMFALGNDYQVAGEGDPVSLHYLDVTNPGAPLLLGTSTFGQGWAWTPATGTFKAFTMDATKGLVVLPFSGWDPTGQGYNNGLQLIQFTPTTVTTAGTAHTKGYVERGIFVGSRLVSLSDLSLAVVDYTNPMAPKVMTELTLARNVITAQPNGNSVAEISSDWFDNDTTNSQVRVLPIANAEEAADTGTGIPTVNVDGVGAQVFTNGQYTYIVTSVRTDNACPGSSGTGCYQRAQQVQVVDLANGGAVLRGKIQLPPDAWGWYGGWGWEGFWWYDWWGGDGIVQVEGDALAFRRWNPTYDANGNYVDSDSQLFVVDLSDPDAPHVASTVVETDPQGWWGDMKVVGDTLYTTHYEWIDSPNDTQGWVRYYLDSIDLGDRSHPRVGNKVNVPGVLVGGDASDPSIVYTIDYRWEDGQSAINDFDVLRIHGSKATLLSHTTIQGWVGSTFVSGKTAYLSAQQYTEDGNNITQSRVDLHAIDLTTPGHPHDRVASDHGWGWLLAVVGDRMLVTSGWGEQALDVYHLADGKAPQFEQTIRTRGWSVNGVSRQDNTLFLSSGYWGVQKVSLQ
jgi:hypothetical protein